MIVAGRDDRGLGPEIPALAARRRLPAARRPALRRAQRRGRDRPLRPARPRGPGARAGHPRRRPPDLQAAARMARPSLGRTPDPRRPPRHLAGPGEPSSTPCCAAIRAACGPPAPAEPSWLASWREADARAAAAIDAVLGDGLSEPNVVRTLAGRALARRHAPRRRVDAGARARVLLAGARLAPARARQPRRERHRRNDLDRVRDRRRQPRADVRAARRRRARPRHRRPARRAPPRDPADDRADRQRRRGDLRPPADRHGRPTSTSSTSRPRRASISRTPRRSTACPTANPTTLDELRAALEAPGLIHVRTDRARELALAQRLTSIRVGAPRA